MQSWPRPCGSRWGDPAITVEETGGVLRIFGAGIPRLLPLEPATVRPGRGASPTRLVRARSGVVPFTVHHHVHASLLDWCTNGVAFSARVLGGRAGSGKTRLGVLLCEDMAAFGWVRGLLTPVPDQPEVEALLAAPAPRLVVVDYAETRAVELAVEVYRRVAAANPAAYEHALATSLNNLSNRLVEAGRREAAAEGRSEAAAVEERVRRRTAGPSA